MFTTTHRLALGVLSSLLLAGLSGPAEAMTLDAADELAPRFGEPPAVFEVTQSNGMSLSQAVDSVRRRGNVERVISAQTRVSGGREVHHIKVLTKDGKVRTHKVQGRRRN